MVMKRSNWSAHWGVVASIFATIGSSSVLAFKIGVINEKVISIEKTLEDILEMKTDITEMKVKLDVLWRAHLSKSTSSIKLNEDDLDALKASGIEKLVDNKYSEILSKVKALKPDNATQAQELLISVVNEYKGKDDCRTALRDASLSSGYDVDSLLFITAISIKNKVILDLGFRHLNP
jgi:hypothetical protein